MVNFSRRCFHVGQGKDDFEGSCSDPVRHSKGEQGQGTQRQFRGTGDVGRGEERELRDEGFVIGVRQKERQEVGEGKDGPVQKWRLCQNEHIQCL